VIPTSDCHLDKPTFAAQPSFASPPPAPASPATGASVVAAPSPRHAELAESGPSLVAPLAVLALLGAAAFFLTRRAAGPGRSRSLRVLETTSLGPRRSLVLAEVNGEWLLLGSSEAGLALLKSGPATPAPAMATAPALHHEMPEAPDAAGMLAAVLPFRARPAPQPPRVHQERMPWLSMWERIRGTKPAAPTPSFEQVLEESAEDELLRRKLQAGMRGQVTP
jgi:flagellar biosynthetic protein FliO